MEESKPKKTREEMESFIEQFLEFSGGDIGMIKVIEKEVSNRAYCTRGESTGDKKRYIKQNELSLTCYYLLSGHSYDEALRLAAEDVETQHNELQEACKTDHKREYLNNMYDKATEDNHTSFRAMKDQGYLKKADYKGKTRPRTGLKNIERAVSHKQQVDTLCEQVGELETQMMATQGSSLITRTEVEDINSLLGLGLTEEEKIIILLQHNYKPSMICDIVGCNKFKVSRIKRRLKGETNEYNNL